MQYMKEALKQAKKATDIGEIPIGAVIVHNGAVIARGYNKRETKKNALLHAEIVAIDKACKKLGGWRLPECEMYVTLEPCPMCMGAIISARIDKLYFGAYDEKSGACGSVCDLSCALPHKVWYQGGVMEDECRSVIAQFFKELREKRKNKTKGEKNNEI